MKISGYTELFTPSDLPFGKIQSVPKDGKPVTKYLTIDDAFMEITKGIKDVAKRLIEKSGKSAKAQAFSGNVGPSSTAQGTLTVEAGLPRSSNLAIPKPFTDHERDIFISESFEYIARFFEGSLEELQARNPDVKTRFQRFDTRAFEAFAYRNGNQLCKCGIWLSDSFGSQGPSTIAFCYSGVSQRNSFNEIMSVKDNGNVLGLEPIGIWFHKGGEKKLLTFEGAAEYFWSMFFEPMQRGN